MKIQTETENLGLPLLGQEKLGIRIGLVPVIAVQKTAHGENATTDVYKSGMSTTDSEVDEEIVVHGSAYEYGVIVVPGVIQNLVKQLLELGETVFGIRGANIDFHGSTPLSIILKILNNRQN